ncbi:hypothetical protein CCHL11_08109 [Colletotrichum chlorophyti]|uniref:Cation/H+ exchanger transmembrane domain-containing protein n=1 Tax=Colletotrichum chlorophyti TaxID=708187 RepID=A0A1Q8S1F5_9PEZI|nr:hypothetical protein CCHL11_08109 [Colletotrichum chlorophyti]
MATTASSLAYHEPSITNIIILSGFLLLLNSINYGLDKLIYCGLIGQVFIGIAWGTPGAKWLSEETEHSIVQLGYLGLILIALKANFLLSIGVAVTGIAVPIGLSFILCSMVGASPLQAFAAGAALCSTSLGTTFTVLGTSGLSTTRMGVVLTSAAMMDDVVGLIMVQVVSSLGSGSGGDFSSVTVIRPVFVSLAFATLVPAACRFVVQPSTLYLNALREKSPGSTLDRILGLPQTALVIHTAWLLGLVVGGTFAGTSGLLAAYIAGATISWWDSEVPHVAARGGGENKAAAAQPTPRTAGQKKIFESGSSRDAPSLSASAEPETHNSGAAVYEHFYSQAVESILKPFFFASIGFSVPITRMFAGHIVWRGLVYTILMMISKMLCGGWLLSVASPLHTLQRIVKLMSGPWKKQSKKLAPGGQCSRTVAGLSTSQGDPRQHGRGEQEGQAGETTLQPVNGRQDETPPTNTSPKPEMPVSVYPAGILGFAMIARGEIGYLISALAESKGIFSGASGAPGQASELFLIVTWAITLCTIVGPICVGLLVGRVRRLELKSTEGVTRNRWNVLGVWGVN